jgi:hypothetical protein
MTAAYMQIFSYTMNESLRQLIRHRLVGFLHRNCNRTVLTLCSLCDDAQEGMGQHSTIRMVTGVVMAVTLFELTFYAFFTLLAVTTADDTPFLEHLRADASTVIGVVRTPLPR